MQPKEASIGGTINLGNYESFKFEFRGIIETPEDYLDLAAFAAGSLLSQGAKADGEVRGKIRGFVGKVFGLPDEKVPDVRVAPAAEPAPTPAAPKEGEKRETKAWGGGDPRPLKEGEKPAPAKPALEKKPTTPTSKYTCEVCGAPISATQQQMSQLFASRTLCKLCFDKLREASR